MNVWEHSLIGQRKFGGKPEDYLAIHRFIYSSKLFYYHIKHRLLLHNLYGVELAVELFVDTIINADNAHIPVRDIAVEHIREDLDGKIPTLNDWLKGHADGSFSFQIPDMEQDQLNSFLWKPYLRSGIKDSLLITCSDFGISLMEIFYGPDAALKLTGLLSKEARVRNLLDPFQFSERWQYSPQKEEIRWLKAVTAGNKLNHNKEKQDTYS